MRLKYLYHISTLLSLLFYGLKGNATHIVGGEITAEYMGLDAGGDWIYRIVIRIYKDCNPIVTGTFDDPLLLTAYDGNNKIVLNDRVFLKSTPDQLPVIVDNPCLIAPPNICTELGIYETDLHLPVSSVGYTITYERCCRNAGIVNIIQPGNTGSTYTIRIPGTIEIGNNPNSTPKFKNYPPLVLCLNDSISFDHSANDADGDSLIYELCTPYEGASYQNPRPSTNSPPPYSLITWASGYSGLYQMNANPPLAIDRFSGRLSGTPVGVGKFVVGVCVSEYRNGIFLSQNKRDFQFTVTLCDPNSVAAASSQERFCDGLTVDFKNNSSNAISYYWDFGDLSTLTDTSTKFEPVYTYSDTGKYIITLIANPGYTCADTVRTEYEIYELLEPFFNRPEGQCFNKHSFDLTAGGEFQSYAEFEWIFGSLSVSSGSYQANPGQVKFTEPGEFPVTLIIREDGCEEEYTDTLFVYPNPEPRFDVDDRSSCVPSEVEFQNTSSAWSTIAYYWDFGDGTTSTEASPVHIYQVPGIYDVSLIATTEGVCNSAVRMLKYNFIKVNAIPKASLIADRLEAPISNPVIRFSDDSKGARTCHLFLGDGLESVNCDYEHRYWQSGKYIVKQVVSSQFGCTDTNEIDVVIRPNATLFVPNTFTPNADHLNEIFRAYGEPVKSYDFRIYDRWGKLIYHSTDLESGWDGTIRGKDAANDVYLYHIDLIDALDEDHELVGSFTLLR